MDDAERDSRTTAIGLARYAREFYDAAMDVDDAWTKRKPKAHVAPAPLMYLLAHAIELSLKSYLRHEGKSVREVTRLRHDLMRCWKAAKDHGIGQNICLTDEELEVLRVLNDLHLNNDLRYIETGAKVFPAIGPLVDVADKIVRTICPLVGYR